MIFQKSIQIFSNLIISPYVLLKLNVFPMIFYETLSKFVKGTVNGKFMIAAGYKLRTYADFRVCY